ncbi:hypothetical protein AHAS_Ahas05G0055500 [Arachis hypogaea]
MIEMFRVIGKSDKDGKALSSNSKVLNSTLSRDDKLKIPRGDTSSANNLRWTEEMDATFLDALIEECSKRNRVDGTFTTSAYDNVLATLKASFRNYL